MKDCFYASQMARRIKITVNISLKNVYIINEAKMGNVSLKNVYIISGENGQVK